MQSPPSRTCCKTISMRVRATYSSAVGSRRLAPHVEQPNGSFGALFIFADPDGQLMAVSVGIMSLPQPGSEGMLKCPPSRLRRFADCGPSDDSQVTALVDLGLAHSTKGCMRPTEAP
jgi:hypothetical protein